MKNRKKEADLSTPIRIHQSVQEELCVAVLKNYVTQIVHPLK